MSKNLPLQNQLTEWFRRRTTPTGVRRVVSLGAAIASDVGNVREGNQDRAVIARGRDWQGREFVVAAVADGIGGMRDGATCAALTLGTFLAFLYQYAQSGDNHSDLWIRGAVGSANQAVFSSFRGEGGSTLAVALMRPDHQTYWLSVGDSRVYSATRKELTQISVDDTIAGQLGKTADAGFEQSKLLQFIGMGDDLEPHIDRLGDELVDTVLLTTDGVHYLAAAPGWLGNIVEHASDPGVCVKRLVDLAKWCGGLDNATVAMISTMKEQKSEDAAPPYRCLEVWDAFGELQIIIEDSLSKALPVGIGQHQQVVGTIDQTSPKVPVVENLVTAPAADSYQQPTPELQAPKARRAKSPRKRKTPADKQGKRSSKSAEIENPQLLVDFPTKKTY